MFYGAVMGGCEEQTPGPEAHRQPGGAVFSPQPAGPQSMVASVSTRSGSQGNQGEDLMHGPLCQPSGFLLSLLKPSRCGGFACDCINGLRRMGKCCMCCHNVKTPKTWACHSETE